MKRRKVGTFLNSLYHFIRYNSRSRKFLAAVHNPVAHRTDFVQAFQNAALFVCQRVNHHLNRLLMGRHRCFGDFLFPAFRLVNKPSVNADAFAQSLCQHALGCRIDNLVF